MDKKMWKERALESECEQIDGLEEVHSIAQRLLIQRGITTRDAAEKFLRPNYDTDLHDPFLFRHMRKVVDRVTQAREKGEKIGIFGDHDVDGISSATLLHEALRDLGVENSVYIPDKHSEGHGINKVAIDQFLEEGATIMISVDCGSTNHDEIAYANTKGIDTIVVDHHNTPEKLPDVYAMINPKVADDSYPFEGLCGTAAVFKVITALYQELKPEDVAQLKWLLDVVGVGTVADVMPLIDENRTLVKYGLMVLSKTKRIGYQEMIAVGRIPISADKVPDARTIAFQIAPRINAAGRMAVARDAFELLIETDRAQARVRALDIEAKNTERRKLTDQLVKEVTGTVEEHHKKDAAIIVASEHYPVGVIGIIAGRIASEYNRPVGVFHLRDNGEMQGSFRSAAGINLVAALEECKKHLMKFGGHNQAAGATLEQKNFSQFSRDFTTTIAKHQKDDVMAVQEILFDATLEASDIDFDLVEIVDQFAPFGEGNAEPLFCVRDMMVVERRFVGKGEKHVKLALRAGAQSPQTFDVIGFSAREMCEGIEANDHVDLLCTVSVNEWNGSRSVQMKLVDITKKS